MREIALVVSAESSGSAAKLEAERLLPTLVGALSAAKPLVGGTTTSEVVPMSAWVGRAQSAAMGEYTTTPRHILIRGDVSDKLLVMMELVWPLTNCFLFHRALELLVAAGSAGTGRR